MSDSVYLSNHYLINSNHLSDSEYESDNEYQEGGAPSYQQADFSLVSHDKRMAENQRRKNSHQAKKKAKTALRLEAASNNAADIYHAFDYAAAPIEELDIASNENHATPSAEDRLHTIRARQAAKAALVRARRTAKKNRASTKRGGASAKDSALHGFNDVDGGLIVRLHFNEKEEGKKMNKNNKKYKKDMAAKRRKEYQVVKVESA